ncbi:hypothetical protein ACFFGT_30060 [Mucilaginibacter angelicae]|uniref:Uncharacterized protein n=1 Tax=Mucilaginibacter angelicae TaxID=869718 RepID=A0ABV6LG96_9SPHI
MSTVNILFAEMACSNCNNLYEQQVQFRFGELWQYSYKMGDRIKRGDEYYDIGKPGLPKVKALGCLVNNICPFCGFESPEDCDIIIEFDIIKDIQPLADLSKYTEENDYSYFINDDAD